MPPMPTLADVRAHFRRSAYPQLAGFVSEVDRGTVVLRGDAATYYAKQVIQTIAARCPGVRGVTNAVNVKDWQTGRPLAS